MGLADHRGTFHEEAAANGADTITGSGGYGCCIIDYSERTAPVRVSIDGVANDGEDAAHDGVAEEGDNVSDVWEIDSGSGDDVLVGRDVAADFIIKGGAGADVISGLGGYDSIYGGPGADQIDGGTPPGPYLPGLHL